MELQDENGQIPPDGLSNAYAEKDAMPFLPEAWSEFASAEQIEAGVKGGSWISIGPGNIGGRIRSIIIQPPATPATPRTIWVGGVAGGVWKTTDGGVTWSTNTDSLANLAVNCMAIEPGYHAPNHEVLYAGTGEGFGNFDALQGNGIFKTIDGGTTWNRLPSPVNDPDFAWVNRLAISPNNSQLLLAAVRVYPPPPQQGVYGKILRSTNGGTSWTTSLTLSGVPMTDVRFKPSSTEAPIPDVPAINCVASSYNGHVYYSTDNGATCTTRADNLGLPPPFIFQRVELAYSRSNPSIVYASKAAVTGSTNELFRSENGGFSFTSLGHPYAPTVPNGLPGASWYTNVLWVDPFDPDTVIVGGIYLLRTKDRGAHYEEASSVSTHLDHHAMVEDPLYDGVNNKTVYDSNDGGIHRTDDILLPCPNGNCVNWTSLNHRLIVTQFYGAAGHAASGTIIGGTQDNGTVRFDPSAGAENWSFLRGGDAAFCAVDQTTNPYFYGEFASLAIYRNKNDGSPTEDIWLGIPHGDCGTLPYANLIAPFVIDPNPNQENRILAGGRSLWRTTNARAANASQVSWPPIKDPIPQNCMTTNNCINISAIAVAEGDSDIIWVGYNNNGPALYTTNGTSTTPSWNSGDPNNVLPQNRMSTRITIGHPTQSDPPDEARTVYVTFSGFYPSLLDTRGNV